jgi:methionine-rich copper-binding protein CopC
MAGGVSLGLFDYLSAPAHEYVMKSAIETILTVCLVVLFHSKPVFAHIGIATTVPEHDAVIDQAPALLRFTFPGEVTITNLRILPVDKSLRQTGETITVRLPRNRIGQSTAFGKEIDLAIPLLESGIYQVVFQVRSIDGHELVDDYVFTVTPGK